MRCLLICLISINMKEALYDMNGQKLPEEAINWTANDFIEYYSKLYGVMTMDEFQDFNLKLIDMLFPQKNTP